MKSAFFLALVLCLTGAVSLHAQKQIYEVRVYQMQKQEQITATDTYLQRAYLPALHRLGVKKIGVFKPLTNDTGRIKMIYVLVTYSSLALWHDAQTAINKDQNYLQAGQSFLQADTAHLPYSRFESTLVEAFPDQMTLVPPSMQVNAQTIYELRSYESPTEHLHERKVTMFNAGGEIPLFKRLGFNGIFYGDVIAGSKMPNLMYMIVFESDSARSAHWKTFGGDPEWKTLSSNPLYENNISVSHIDSILLHRTDYSEL